MSLYIEKISGLFPLEINNFHWEQESLTLVGSGWSFSTSSPWRVVDAQGFLFGSESSPSNQELSSLTKIYITEAKPTGHVNLDIKFILSNGNVFECFSATSFEPWVFNLPNGIIIVADGSAA